MSEGMLTRGRIQKPAIYLLLCLLPRALLALVLSDELFVVLAQQFELDVMLLVALVGRVQALEHVHQQRHQGLHDILVVARDHALELAVDAARQVLHLLRHHHARIFVRPVDDLRPQADTRTVI